MATEAEAGVTQPPAQHGHQELDEAGGTLPWSPQREHGPTPELTLLAPELRIHFCCFKLPNLRSRVTAPGHSPSVYVGVECHCYHQPRN